MNAKFWLTKPGIGAGLLITSATYFLLMEHREHVFQALPFLIILLCPLMHILMHAGHGKHDHTTITNKEQEAYQRGLEAGRLEAKVDTDRRRD